MTTPAPLPPGSTGLPLLGETLDFARDGFGFVQDRVARHGPIFRTSLLGRKAIGLVGLEATERFIDPADCAREGSMPANIQALFGGRSLPLLDGATHRARKTLVFEALTAPALESYLPAAQRGIEKALEGFSLAGEVRAVHPLKRLALETIAANLLGLAPGPRLDALLADYATTSAGFTALPIPLPFTRYSRAIAARDRIFAALDEEVRAHRGAPPGDGLSRMLAARTPEGAGLSDEEARLELHHLVVAGFIVFAEWAVMLLELGRAPAIAARAREEVRRLSPSGPLTIEALARLPLVSQVVMEAKRLTPIIPCIFGKAKRTFTVGGFTVPEGWGLLWGVRAHHLDPSIYARPEAFDPDRFSDERAEHRKHPHAFVPQGAGPALGHRCPGLDYATLLMATFAVVMLRSYEWELPPQDLGFDWSKMPPEPREGLRVRVRRPTV